MMAIKIVVLEILFPALQVQYHHPLIAPKCKLHKTHPQSIQVEWLNGSHAVEFVTIMSYYCHALRSKNHNFPFKKKNENEKIFRLAKLSQDVITRVKIWWISIIDLFLDPSSTTTAEQKIVYILSYFILLCFSQISNFSEISQNRFCIFFSYFIFSWKSIVWKLKKKLTFLVCVEIDE